MIWFDALPAALASAALLVLPGAAVGWGIGLRRLWLVALAPAISATLLGVAAVVLPLAHLTWQPVTALGFAAVFGVAVVALLRLALRAKVATRDFAPGGTWAVAVGWLFCAAVLVSVTMVGIGDPAYFSQTIDNVFHMNAIALIGDTGNASPFSIGVLTDPVGSNKFYPDTYHAIAQLALQLTGSSISVTMNGFNLALLAVVWPAGVLLLSRQFTGASRVGAIATGVFAATLPAFPLNMMIWGVLYPYLFGLAMVPATLALVMNLLGVSRESRLTTPWPQAVLLAGVTGGVAITHPGAMMGALALSVPVATVAYLRGFAALSGGQKLRRTLGFGAYGVAGLALMIALRQADWWGARMTLAQALKNAATLSLEGYGLPLLTALCVIGGLVIAARRRGATDWAAIGIWAVAATLFVVTAGSSSRLLRLPTRLWYGDAPRLSALFVVAVIPAAVLAVVWLVKVLGRKSGRESVVATGALVSLAAVTVASADYPSVVERMTYNYAITDTSRLITTDEAALIARIPDEVAPDEMIAGSPWTGAALAYAFTGREVIYPHVLMNDVGPERMLIMQSFKQAATDPKVCDAVNELNVRYVLDFGTKELTRENHRYDGIEKLDRSPVFTLVDHEGDAKLYRFTGCQ